jgi:hypothetical protein
MWQSQHLLPLHIWPHRAHDLTNLILSFLTFFSAVFLLSLHTGRQVSQYDLVLLIWSPQYLHDPSSFLLTPSVFRWATEQVFEQKWFLLFFMSLLFLRKTILHLRQVTDDLVMSWSLRGYSVKDSITSFYLVGRSSNLRNPNIYARLQSVCVIFIVPTSLECNSLIGHFR